MPDLLTMLIGSALALPFSVGIAAAEPDWVRLDYFDRDLSFEVPCASDEIDFTEEGGAEFGGTTREVRCSKSGVAFRISVTEFTAHDGREPMFDSISNELFAASAEAKPVALTISGHRTTADRGEMGELLGQRALVEINAAKIAFVIVAGDPSVGPDREVQRDMIDRFFSTLQVRS